MMNTQKRVQDEHSVRLAVGLTGYAMQIPAEKMLSVSERDHHVARARQVAMYLAKQLTARSLPEIGRKFGGRDHTTVMHAVKKVDELRQSDRSFAEDVELLRRMLEG